jgi:exodeoxyribonuclease VII small subunit
MTFEETLARLEEIVDELDGDGVALDRALALFEEGIAHLREASAALGAAESRLKVLQESAAGALELRDAERGARA